MYIYLYFFYFNNKNYPQENGLRLSRLNLLTISFTQEVIYCNKLV